MPAWLELVWKQLVDQWQRLLAYITPGQVAKLVAALALIVLGFVLARVLSAVFARVVRQRIAPHMAQVAQRVMYYVVLLLMLVQAMTMLGFDLSILLGAAGILTVAIGFASQTSMSNLISGIFLLAERPFVVSDIVKIGETTGEVLSIDLLSLKLRTFDNLYVRIPNQTVINSEVVNLTHFPIRRIDIQVGVAYKEDLDRVRRVLLDVADKNPLCLEEPEPLYIFQGFGDSALNIQFSVWAQRENYLTLKNNIQAEIKRAFDEQGIEIPFPQRSLSLGSGSAPFPMRLVDEKPAPDKQDAEPGGVPSPL
jgi:small-conductance mechanosensitive channel